MMIDHEARIEALAAAKAHNRKVRAENQALWEAEAKIKEAEREAAAAEANRLREDDPFDWEDLCDD